MAEKEFESLHLGVSRLREKTTQNKRTFSGLSRNEPRYNNAVRTEAVTMSTRFSAYPGGPLFVVLPTLDREKPQSPRYLYSVTNET